ncbi:DUF3000 domain-containing protein [Actinomyces johnsonii]|uniref:DUF3000 domain-containing protein n=3 Tax=Actinomyces johnsonii TaxID=544581 RepID=A0A508A6X8_9ACTO|nr:DUF3000 domain-containing protein [Actinomyces johnsonii]TQD42745.1 DUF3000 domain-containing protein [Actinomyces johnsonii]
MSVSTVTVNGRPRQNEAGAIPERFEEALLSLRDAPRPRGLLMEEVPAPKKLAPYSAALSAETVETVGATPIATGRFVVLYDPNGQDAWDGDFRIVIQARARIDDEVGMDPVFESAAWSWLTDGLEDSRAGYRALVGTVTRVLSETFGGLTLTDSCAHAEIRASWSPTTAQLGPHLTAWHELLLVASGHEPAAVHPLTLAGVAR